MEQVVYADVGVSIVVLGVDTLKERGFEMRGCVQNMDN